MGLISPTLIQFKFFAVRKVRVELCFANIAQEFQSLVILMVCVQYAVNFAIFRSYPDTGMG